MSQEPAHDPETPYQAAEMESTEKSNRQGKLFFNLCDMRVATVGVNVLNIIVIFIGLLYKMITLFGWMPIQAAFPAFILSGIAIFGAVNFELWALVMAIVGFIVSLAADLVWLNIFGIIMGVLVLYPTVTFAKEVHKGIMTKESYRTREEFIDFPMVEKAGIKKTHITKLHETIGKLGKKEQTTQG